MTKAAELAKMGEVLTNSQIGGRRNMVINGAMNIAQRATSATGVGGTNEEYPTIDRFNFTTTSAGRFTMEQVADVHDGFANAMKLSCTTADTSISASEALILQTKFEGQDMQQLRYGSSSAESITVSFYVKGNASATYTLEWRNEEDGRNIGKTFNVTTDWTRVIITFAGDTGGSPVDDDNTHAFTLGIWLHGGSTFSGGTFTENVYHSTHNQRIGDGQTSFLDSTDRTFFITGLQMEVGEQATPFEHRSFGEEQRLCQRYAIVYSKNGQPNMGQKAIGTGASTNSSGAYQAFIFPQVTMRAVPTLTVGGSVSDYEILKYETGFVDLNSSISLYSASGRSLFVLAISSATAEAERGRDVIMRLEGDNSSLLFDSEL